MGNLQDWVFSQGKHYSFVFFLFFLILSSTHSRIVIPGRAISKLNKADSEIGVGTGKWMIEKRVIGSRPPRCDSKCSDCGHCFAVQIPIAPPLLLQIKTTKKSKTPKFIAYSRRGDDLSNYKPICWMCKCGDFIFTP